MTKIRVSLAALLLTIPLAACGKGASPDAVCKKLGELAEKEGGEAKEMWTSRLANDCTKEVAEEKQKMGDEKWNTASDCIMKAATFMDAMKCAK
jgi:hypothetical protein